MLEVFIQNSDLVDSVLLVSAITKAEVIGLGPNSLLLRQYKKSLVELSPTQKEAAIGLMLGDASLQTQNGGKTFRMKFE